MRVLPTLVLAILPLACGNVAHSFFVDGGAFPDVGTPDVSSSDATITTADGGPLDATCASLASCCAILQGAAQALCGQVAAANDASSCAEEQSLLQGAGDCTGVSIVASGIQLPATRLISDGTTLFFTDYFQSAGLLAVPVGGGAIMTLATGIVQLVDVDDVNVYAIVVGPLDSIGEGNVGTEFIANGNLVRIPKSGAPASRISTGGWVWGATTLAGTAYWMETPGQSPGGPAIESASLQGGPVSVITPMANAVTDLGLAQIGATDTAIFLGAFHAVTYFPIASPSSVASGPPTFCESFASDSDAVYCDVGNGSNLRIASDGTTTTLGSVVTPTGTDPYPYSSTTPRMRTGQTTRPPAPS